MSGGESNGSGIGATLSAGLDIYNFVDSLLFAKTFKNVTKAAERVMPPPDIEPNRVQLSSEIPKVSPEIIKGLQVTHSTPIAERVSRTNTWKLCGQGNPMMGMPSNSLEVGYFIVDFC